jgi:hypothetical protein
VLNVAPIWAAAAGSAVTAVITGSLAYRQGRAAEAESRAEAEERERNHSILMKDET